MEADIGPVLTMLVNHQKPLPSVWRSELTGVAAKDARHIWVRNSSSIGALLERDTGIGKELGVDLEPIALGLGMGETAKARLKSSVSHYLVVMSCNLASANLDILPDVFDELVDSGVAMVIGVVVRTDPQSFGIWSKLFHCPLSV